MLLVRVVVRNHYGLPVSFVFKFYIMKIYMQRSRGNNIMDIYSIMYIIVV